VLAIYGRVSCGAGKIKAKKESPKFKTQSPRINTTNPRKSKIQKQEPPTSLSPIGPHLFTYKYPPNYFLSKVNSIKIQGKKIPDSYDAVAF
jgi:hypothetical protein